MKKLLLAFCLFIGFNTFSQNLKLSVYSEVSILTVGPGDQLFTAFGHTAIRIKDPLLRIDHVYNYGMFDFNQPNFYLNFAEGKLLYKLGAYSFKKFVQQNAYEKRWVKEQVLNLNQSQRQEIFQFLSTNLLPENVSYLYDPFFNNCATKPIEIIEKTIKDVTLNNDFVSEKESIRRLMNKEQNQNTWGSFGINLALGNKIDKKATHNDYLYLPDFVYLSLQKATIKSEGKDIAFVRKENEVLRYKEIESEASFLNPLLITLIILTIGILITYRDFKRKKITNWFDITLLGITGLAGIGIVFLWFFTNHITTPNNFNILWCFPLNIIALFFFKREKWLKKYFVFLTALLVLLPIVWLLRIQEFNYTIIPLILVLGLRYLSRIQLLSSKE